MAQMLYAMQFSGTGTPGDDGTLHASTSSPSTQITSTVGASGLEGRVEAADGNPAHFTSDVKMTGDTTFTETGTISFGEGNSVRFSTIGQGYIAASPEEGLSHGAVMWRIDSGEGQFDGASGIITSNFTLSTDGVVTDNQFGVVWLR